MMGNKENKEIKKIEVTIYFSTFCTYQLEAENTTEAILQARRLKIDEAQILSHLENWEEADEANVIVL